MGVMLLDLHLTSKEIRSSERLSKFSKATQLLSARAKADDPFLMPVCFFLLPMCYSLSNLGYQV